MKKVKKLMVIGALTAIVATAFTMKAGATSETCTLDSNGTCECVAVFQNGSLIGYKCVSGTSSAKCVCISNPA